MSDSVSPDDPIGAVFGQLRSEARVFFTGALCGVAAFPGGAGPGHLHLLRHGRIEVTDEASRVTVIEGPAAVLFPRAARHRLTSDGDSDLVCAEIDLGGAANPFHWALPSVIWLPLNTPGARLRGVLELLFAEAAEQRAGRRQVVDRLAEVTLIHLLRHAMESGPVDGGLLAGLAHPQIARALRRIHEAPHARLTLDDLAEAAGLSRSSFALTFHRVVGRPPGQYLTGWRLALAHEAILRGRPLKTVARDIGYRSPAALSRAFARHFGSDARSLRRETNDGR